MTRRIRDAIPLSDEQIHVLRVATDHGKRQFPAGYALVHDWIKDHPAAQADGTVFWFEQARGINKNDSLSARFIRRHTENGLDLAEVPLSLRLPMQELSNKIAERVTGDLLEQGKVPPLAKILDNDIRVAIEEGSVKLGGWGGSFYFYDMPYKPDEKDMPQRPGLRQVPGEYFLRKPDGRYHTVGDEIDAQGGRELLLKTSSKTIKDMVIAGEIRLSDAPELLQTSWNAGMPATMKAEVTLRAGVMVAEHVREHVDESLRQIPDELQRLLEQQRRHLLDRSGQTLDNLLNPSLPGMPRISAQHTGMDASQWQQLATQLDGALDRNRALAHRQDAFDAPTQHPRGPFKGSHANAAYAALLAGDSDALDRIAIEFSQTPEGQRLAQLGDQLLAQQQMLEQQQLQEQQLAQAQQQEQAHQGPVLRR